MDSDQETDFMNQNHTDHSNETFPGQESQEMIIQEQEVDVERLFMD